MSQLLCLHAGAKRVPVSFLDTLPTPPPSSKRKRTITEDGREPITELINPHVPIAHSSLVAEVKSCLLTNNIAITDEEHAVWGGDSATRYFGLLHLQFPSSPSQTNTNPSDFSWLLGLRNAHDKSMSAGGVLGTRVFVCDNTAFSGDIAFGAKHSAQIEKTFKTRIMDALTRLLAGRSTFASTIDQMKRTTLDHSLAHDRRSLHDLLVRAVELDVLPVTLLPAVARTFRDGYFSNYNRNLQATLNNPPDTTTEPFLSSVRSRINPDNELLDPTLWALYNCITDGLRHLGPDQLTKRTSRLTTMFAGEVFTSPTVPA